MRRQAGTVLVEFLIVFPAFLVLSMFVLEVGFWWADRHMTRLAAFEAARVYAAANLPYWEDGTSTNDLCAAAGIKKRAKQAALRKVAIIAPPIQILLSRLGDNGAGLNLGDLTDPTNPTGGGISGAALRIAERWPTAAVSTEETACHYDQTNGSVRVGLRYHRLLQTPFIDRVIFLIYRIAEATPAGGTSKIRLDQNFMGVSATELSPAALQQARLAMGTALQTVRSHHLPLAEAAALMSDVPGIAHVFGRIPSIPVDLLPRLLAKKSDAETALAGTAGTATTVDQQSQLLATIVGSVASGLWRIPIDVEVTLQRDAFTKAASNRLGPKEPVWDGQLKGAINLNGSSDYTTELRRWSHQLSVGQDGTMNATAKPLGED